MSLFNKTITMRCIRRLLSLFIAMLLCLPATSSAEGFSELLPGLTSKSYKEKEAVINNMAALNDRKVLIVMRAMLNGELYYTKEDNKLVIAIKKEDDYSLTDPVKGESLGVVSKSEIKKVKTNNKLRKALRSHIAKLNLKDDDASIRYAAATEMIQNLDNSTAVLFEDAIKTEEDEDVKEVIETGLAIYGLGSSDKNIRIASISQLKGSLYPQVKVVLLEMLERDDDGSYIEHDSDIRKAAKTSLSVIETRVNLNDFVENAFFGLSLGSVLLLAAIGLAITFGVMGVINMAHGELIMLGAYTTYIIQSLMPDYLEYSLFISIPAAFMVSGLFGVAIERGVIRFLYGRPLETLLATFGISLILQQLVRTTISAQNVIVSTPSWMSGSLQINPVLSITYNRLYIFLFSLIVFVALLYVLKRTVLGLQVRAVSQNRAMAKAMGVRSDWVDALTFGLGSGIAGIAGVALSQLTNVGPNLGQSYIIDSFMVVVFGGVGNLWGTLVGAMSLGVVNKFLEPWAGAVLAKILVLIFIILFIQKCPRGLFPKKGRAAED